jgi:hypothetical protein
MEMRQFRSIVLGCTQYCELNVLKRSIDGLESHANVFLDLPNRRQLIDQRWSQLNNGHLIVRS